MRILLEIFLFAGIFFPIYHMCNVLFSLKKSNKKEINEDRFISILIPCYNEEKIIKNTIEGLIRIDYMNYECLFINDGSTDKTLKELKEVLQLRKVNRIKRYDLCSKAIKEIYQSERYPNMFVIDKENGGKSEALNSGINYSLYDYIVTLDADSILKKDAISIMSGVFNDSKVVAASGIIQIMQSFNLSKDIDRTTLKINNLLKLQTIEYIKSCYCYKASLAKLKSLLVISGAFGFFKKDILLAVDGFSNVIGEDLDITLKIQFFIKNSNQKIAYVPEAICYTEGPETFKDYVKQRKRWQQSFIHGLISFRKTIFKATFTEALPFFMIVDALFLGIISSFVILFSSVLIITNTINGTLWHILIYLYIFVLIHLIYNIIGLCIACYYGIKFKGMDIIRLIFTVILDIFIYRMIILYTIISGTISYFSNKRDWNKVNRSGYDYDVLKKGNEEYE